jgi:hypothetical protein
VLSVGVQIAQAVEARLNVASVEIASGTKTKPAGLTVERERLTDVRPADVQAGALIIVSIGAEVAVSRVHWQSPKTDRILELLVGVYALASATKGAEATDPAYNWLVQALQSEPRLGGLAHWISEEGYEAAYTRFQDSHEIVCAREVKIHVSFHTRTDNPEVRHN